MISIEMMCAIGHAIWVSLGLIYINFNVTQSLTTDLLEQVPVFVYVTHSYKGEGDSGPCTCILPNPNNCILSSLLS